MAGQAGLESEGPPLTYQLTEVSLRLTKEFGHGFQPQRVSLDGTGRASLERDGKSLPFRYPAEDLLGLLNELYRIRFFQMPANYTTRYSVFLKDDGTVGTSALRLQDAPSTQMCLSVAVSQKCVRFNDQGPRELEELAKRIFSEADRLLQSNPPE